MFAKNIHLIFSLFIVLSFFKTYNSSPFYDEPSEKITEYIDLVAEYEKEIVISELNNTAYIFTIKNNDYIYFFEAEEDGYIFSKENISFPTIYASQSVDSIISLNPFKNASKEIKIKISSIKDNITQINSAIIYDGEIFNKIYIPQVEKEIFIYKVMADYFFHDEPFDKDLIVKVADYKPEMTPEDILSGNETYYEDSNNQIKIFESGKIYIILIESYTFNKANKMLFQAKNLPSELEVDKNTNFLCLSKPQKYFLNYTNNTLIKLSKMSLNSEITIKKNEELIKKLDKNNKYYNFTGLESTDQISIEVTKEDFAIIEFIIKPEIDLDLLEEQELFSYKITRPYLLIKFNNNNKGKKILLKIFSKDVIPFHFLIYSGTAKDNYIYNIPDLDIEETMESSPFRFLMKYEENEELEEDEYDYVFIQLDENQVKNKSYNITLLKVEEFSWEKINSPMPQEKCQKAKDTMKKIFEDLYIYTEIKKNPPDPEYFGKADLLKDLEEVSTENRNYFDFYRDIKKITGKNKDNHFLIDAFNTPEGIELEKIVMCLPFRFIIKQDQNNKPKMYIEKFECYKYYNDTVRNFVDSHLNISLTNINGKTAFQYVQEFANEYFAHHSKHATFTLNMLFSYQVPIFHIPLNDKELTNLTFKFENGSEITLDYYLYNLDFDEELINDPEFEEFFEMDNDKNLDGFLILETVSKYKNMKNNIQKETSNLIEWDYTTEDEGIKCYIDNTNKVNVIVQMTFDYGEREDPYNFYNKCTEQFYNNSYPIIIIESLNNGGVGYLPYYAMTFLQVKILPKYFLSVKKNEFMMEYMKKLSKIEPGMANMVDAETCEAFDWDKAKEIEDKYGNITHKRTQPFTIFSSDELKEFKKRRQQYMDLGHLKKPTEIIIFTDGYSFSATSFFTKGLQEIGGAITVGYYGNPEYPEEKFDASQSTSGELYYERTEIDDNLGEVGFSDWGITGFESFNYSYQGENPTPREYLIYPVDERVNIFEKYDDSKYQKFIDKAKDIFKKYNDDKECNPNNTILLFEPDNKTCYSIEGDVHAHGGYPCGNDGHWNESICVPFYCDIGYYFDTYQKKCRRDICTEGKEENEDKKDGGLENWVIILIAIGGVMLLVVIVLLIVCLRKRGNSSDKIESPGRLLDERFQEN